MAGARFLFALMSMLYFVQQSEADIFFTGEDDADNEVAHKGSILKTIFGSNAGVFKLPSEFLEVEKLRKPSPPSSNTFVPFNSAGRNNGSYTDRRSPIGALTVRSCTPDALPWIGSVGFCVPSGLLRTFCGDNNEASTAVDDCAGYEGNWCCYRPSPTAPPVYTPLSSLAIRRCTPDTHPWVGASGFCAATNQLNTFCAAMEISASNADCPGRENWCCYKTAPAVVPVLTVRQCTPDAMTYLGRTGFCANTNQLNNYCGALEISVASSDCAAYTGNWCCYTPHPRPATLPPRPTTPRPTTSLPVTVAYPNGICQSYPYLPQCQPTTTRRPQAYYFGPTPKYLPCSVYSSLSDCTTTTSRSVLTTRSPVYGMRVLSGAPVNFPMLPVDSHDNFPRSIDH
ncbi:hypothetical protein BV898_14441 [Hypsibius exemplaris]|uniref:WAP domain-containing protein n=1 Tax=Hypsibius exemplaris TaxID=2072580 RepID=A0A9X6NBX9_HYPEX|nr:hypothetical protein BV898_14441 [Hypsibius exemplaris]